MFYATGTFLSEENLKITHQAKLPALLILTIFRQDLSSLLIKCSKMLCLFENAKPRFWGKMGSSIQTIFIAVNATLIETRKY